MFHENIILTRKQSDVTELRENVKIIKDESGPGIEPGRTSWVNGDKRHYTTEGTTHFLDIILPLTRIRNESCIKKFANIVNIANYKSKIHR